jgi:hypothetical protein
MSSSDGPAIGHAVYFTLKDQSQSAIDHLVAECQKLEGHDGAVYFNVGRCGEGFERLVNDNDFDVALYVVFKDRAAHDEYQSWPTHLQFIDRNKESWAQVRVFDTHLAGV